MKVWEFQHRNSQKKHPAIESNTEFTCCPVYLTHNRDSLRVYAAIYSCALRVSLAASSRSICCKQTAGAGPECHSRLLRRGTRLELRAVTQGAAEEAPIRAFCLGPGCMPQPCNTTHQQGWLTGKRSKCSMRWHPMGTTRPA